MAVKTWPQLSQRFNNISHIACGCARRKTQAYALGHHKFSSIDARLGLGGYHRQHADLAAGPQFFVLAQPRIKRTIADLVAFAKNTY